MFGGTTDGTEYRAENPARVQGVLSGQLLRRYTSSGAVWGVLLVWALFAVVPVIWLLISVTKTVPQMSSLNPFAFGSWGNVITSWTELRNFDGGVFFAWVRNSIILSLAPTLISFVVTVPAGYALGTLTFPGRRVVLMITLGMMLLPASSLALPLFLEMNVLHLIGNLWAVILPLSVYPFGLYVTFIYFSTSVSREIYDAGRVDGCSELRVFLHIAVPLSKPIMGLIAFFSFIRAWNEFLLPFIMLGSGGYPLPVGLDVMASVTTGLTSSSSTPGQVVHLPTLLLATIFTMIPILVGILAAQRLVVRGAGTLGGALRG